MIMAISTMQKFIGIFDISIIILFLIAILIGILVGFFRMVIKVANVLCGFIFSLVFASKFSKVIGIFIRKPIYKHYYNKVASSKALSSIDETGDAQAEFVKALDNYNLPHAISKFIAKHYAPDNAADIKDSICSSIASGITKVILTVIAFFILWIGLSILFFILRKMVDGFRENKGFRIVDGTLGVILALLLCFVLVELLMYGFTYADSGKLYNFLSRDMRLETHKGIPIARWFYNKNLVRGFMDMIF